MIAWFSGLLLIDITQFLQLSKKSSDWVRMGLLAISEREEGTRLLLDIRGREGARILLEDIWPVSKLKSKIKDDQSQILSIQQTIIKSRQSKLSIISLAVMVCIVGIGKTDLMHTYKFVTLFVPETVQISSLSILGRRGGWEAIKMIWVHWWPDSGCWPW